MDLDFKNEWLIANLKRDKYKYGLRFLPSLYLEKYTDIELLLIKLKKYFERLSKWEDAINSKINWYQTHEAIIQGKEKRSYRCPFNESPTDIFLAVEDLAKTIKIWERQPPIKELIKTLLESKEKIEDSWDLFFD